eukprot:UN11702
MQGFFSVNHVLIASYASVKHNPKSIMTPEVRMFFLLDSKFHDFSFFARRVITNPEEYNTTDRKI